MQNDERPDVLEAGDKAAIAIVNLALAAMAHSQARRAKGPNDVVVELRPIDLGLVEKGNAARDALITLIRAVTGTAPSSPTEPRPS